MTLSGEHFPVAQHNHGPGTFVGGNVFGNVEVMDETTSTAIADVAAKMPDLATKLGVALKDGLISPEVVRDIADSTRHINYDVASMIWEGGRRINEDVASSLWDAGRHINEDVAEKFAQAARDLQTTANNFDTVTRSLDVSSRKLREARANAGEWARTAAAMDHAAQELAMASQIHSQNQGGFSKNSFLGGLVVGVLAPVLFAILVLVIQVKAHK